MNERKIIDRKLLSDLAKEAGLNASHLEALGESRQWEIVVGSDMLERLVDIQRQFEQLAVMGDDEYRGFYIEVPRPTPEEWGYAEELITSGEYESREAFLADWTGGSISLRANTETPGQSVLRIGSGPVLSLRMTPSVQMQNQMIRGAGRT